MIRFLASVLCVLGIAAAASAQVTLPEEVKVKTNRLTKLSATSATLIKWLNCHEDVDLISDSSGKWAIAVGHKQGRYKIAAYTASADGVPSDPAYCTLVVGGNPPPVPPEPVPPVVPAKPQTSLLKTPAKKPSVRATVISSRQADGKYNVVRAWDGVGPIAGDGQVVLANGDALHAYLTTRESAVLVRKLIAAKDPADVALQWLEANARPTGRALWLLEHGDDQNAKWQAGYVEVSIDLEGGSRYALYAHKSAAAAAAVRWADRDPIVSNAKTVFEFEDRGELALFRHGSAARRLLPFRSASVNRAHCVK